MSTRSHRRISLQLIIGLGFVLMLSLVFWAYNLGKGRGAATAQRDGANPVASTGDAVKPPTPSAPAPAAPATQPAPAIATTVTPTPGGATSSTKPAANVALAAPPTAPSAGASLPLLAAAAGNSTTRPSGAPAVSGAENVQLASLSPVPPVKLGATPLVDAKGLMDAGKLLDARRILNAALATGKLSDDDARSTKQMLGEINTVVVFSPRHFADDELGGTFTVPPRGALARIAQSYDVTPELLMRINGITDARKLQAGKTIKVVKGPFNAIVDKSDFSLELWIGEPATPSGMFVISYPVGLGKDDATPTGVWAVQNKLSNPTYFSPRGEGVIDADDPKNPLGENWIGLSGVDGHALGKKSYGIHGTIEPQSIGKQESMGCIRLTNENVGRVFELLVDGKSTVTVRE